MTIHLELRERIERRFACELARPLELKQDALIVQLRNDVLIELRFAARDEYIINWRWGDAELRIDTAPVHVDLETYPNHLHDADGTLREDPVTRPGQEIWSNVEAAIEALLADPLLQARAQRA